MKKRIKLRTKILILSSILVCSSVLVSGWMMLISISDSFEEEIGERAIAIARTLTQLDDIIINVGQEGGEEYIQPIAERIRLSTNVDYIVILDMNRIRYSHPSETRIGEVFEGGDEIAAYSEHEYTSKALGELGYAIRAFVPIMDEAGTHQVGVAVVGILSPTFQSLVKDYQSDLLVSLVWGLLIGIGGSWFLATNVKKQTYQLEPYEIGRLFEERQTIMQTLDTGIIVTDDKGEISFMNKLAEEYTGYTFSGQMYISEVFTRSWITEQLLESEKVINKPVSFNKTMYLVSIYPIFVKKDFMGSLIILKNRSEIHQLGEELTGVKSLVSALRAQNHEYMNKLHSIAGLIQLDRTDEALELLIEETSDEENMIQFLRDRIDHYPISGLILGKRARAKEMGVHLWIHEDSYLNRVVEGFSSGDLITLIGNLLDNAIESCEDAVLKEVSCLIQGGNNSLYIMVEDSGKGIPTGESELVFQEGYSSKAKEGRGFGLALIKSIVEANQGEISITSKGTNGTIMEIIVGQKIGVGDDG
ncbi:ATP-binding protein [Oceanobacillus kimchii]|uniref:ATP-binding protein n=1 Tax=Oceanobacillus kimchii TaxID=746691 RepID=UPI0009849FBE|nr:sensor histidine kinase [Oceanobacillus kimchii]